MNRDSKATILKLGSKLIVGLKIFLAKNGASERCEVYPKSVYTPFK